MLYRVLRTVNENYALAAMWFYIGAFLLAAAFMFIHPFVTVVVFMLGMASLAAVVLGASVLSSMQRGMARRALAGGRCPRCRSATGVEPRASDRRCPRCGTVFLGSGAEREEDPRGGLQGADAVD